MDIWLGHQNQPSWDEAAESLETSSYTPNFLNEAISSRPACIQASASGPLMTLTSLVIAFAGCWN